LKILWVGDAVITSGFSVVTHNICNLLSKKCDLEVFGVGYDHRIKNEYPYHIYAGLNGLDIYSCEYAAEVIRKSEPDVIIIFNDDAVVANYLSLLSNCPSRVIPMFPVNMLPVSKERMLGFSNAIYGVTDILTYTEFAKKEILKINPNLKVHSVYHGVDKSNFFHVDDAKMKVGLKNQVVVGTVNTNTPRKRLDLFLRGFAKFASGKDDARCLIHAASADETFKLKVIAQDYGILDKTILSNTHKSFKDINILYNMMDVNVNTSVGEGFGLSLVEGAACGVPVLCPKHGNLVDIWGDNATYIEIRDHEYLANSEFIGGLVDVDNYADKLGEFYADRELLSEMGKRAHEHSRTAKFDWETVADKVFKVISESGKERLSFIS